MANPNWQADFEQALAEEDRSDPTSKSIFFNRDLAKHAVTTGILTGFVAAFAAYISQNATFSLAEDKAWWESLAIFCTICACVQVPLGIAAIVFLRRRPPAAAPPQRGMNASPPIGW